MQKISSHIKPGATIPKMESTEYIDAALEIRKDILRLFRNASED